MLSPRTAANRKKAWKSPETRRPLYLASIHSSARDLGIETRPYQDRSTYELILELLINRTSCKYATLEELSLVDDFFHGVIRERTTGTSYGRRTVIAVVVTDEEALDILGVAA